MDLSTLSKRVRFVVVVAVLGTGVVLAIVLSGEPWLGRVGRARGSEASLSEHSEADPVADPPVPAAVPEAVVPVQPPKEWMGETSLEGVVTDANGGAAAGVLVRCLPQGFTVTSEAEFLCHAIRTNDVGRFAFGSLPAARSYALTAYANGAFGSARVPFAEARAARAEVRLLRVVYERLAFHDPDGAAAPLHGRRVLLDRGDALWSSAYPHSTERLREVAWMGFDALDALAPNEAAAIYPEPTVGRQAFVLRLDGFEEVRIPRSVVQLQEAWPTSTRITLRSTGVPPPLWRIALPDLGFPAEWGDPHPTLELHLRVFFGTSGNVHDVVWRRPFATQREEGAPRVLQYGFTELPYKVEGEGADRIVRPDYPEFGYLEVLYMPAPAGRGDPPEESFLIRETWPPVSGTVVYPGCVRFGPLPAGEYTIERYTRGNGAAKSSSLGTYGVRQGLNRHDVR